MGVVWRGLPKPSADAGIVIARRLRCFTLLRTMVRDIRQDTMVYDILTLSKYIILTHSELLVRVIIMFSLYIFYNRVNSMFVLSYILFLITSVPQ